MENVNAVSECNSSDLLDTAMRLSPILPETKVPDESHQEIFIESLPTTSERALNKEKAAVAIVSSASSPPPVAFAATAEPVSSDCAVVIDNLKSSPEKPNIISNVDSRTITRPRRPQVFGDVGTVKDTTLASTENAQNLQTVAIIPPAISTVVQRMESTPVRKLEQSLKNLNDINIREGLKRGDGKQPVHRTRQKTVTVHSQLSLEVANAFKETKDKFGDDSYAEIQRRIQSFIAVKEREWAAAHEKLIEEVDLWEHKAVEHNMLVYEYDRIVKQLAEAIKIASKANALSQPRSQKALLGGPGPERTVSPDEFALLRKERDQLAEDVMSWETSYDELYKRYEKLRQASLEFRKNADDTKNAYNELQEQYEEAKRKFEMLKTEAENELHRANVEMERQEKQRENDTLGLRLKVKHLEAKNSALATSLEAKTRELADMEALFEDIVHKANRNAAGDFE